MMRVCVVAFVLCVFFGLVAQGCGESFTFVLVDAGKVPAPDQDTDSLSDDVPIPEEDISVLEEDTPTPDEDVPMGSDTEPMPDGMVIDPLPVNGWFETGQVAFIVFGAIGFN